jgi:hypothetical protein
MIIRKLEMLKYPEQVSGQHDDFGVFRSPLVIINEK